MTPRTTSSRWSREEMESILRALGYVALFRTAGWIECLIRSDDESFVGRGQDETDALADAMRSALPTHLSRLLLERVLVAGSVESGGDAMPIEEDEPASSVVRVMEAVNDAPAAPPEPVEPSPASPVVEPEDSAASAGPGDDDGRSSLASTDRQEVEIALRDLRDEVRAEAEDVARLAPERQRLQLLGWMCRARALGAILGDGFHEPVAAVARELTTLSKEFWPGSVAALRLNAHPREAVDRRAHDDESVETWDQAATWVQERLERIEAEGADRGEDEDGWCDALRLVPPAPNAETVLRDACRELEELFADDALSADAKSQRAAGIAAKLRWIRRSSPDVIAWGRAIGTLRRWCHEHRGSSERVAAILDPAYVPNKAWARVVQPSDDAERKSRQAELVATFPANDAGALGAWLGAAIDHFDGPELAALVRASANDFGDELARLRQEATDRRMRRRVADVEKRLAAMNPNEASAIARALTSATVTAPPAPQVDPHEALAAAVRPHTVGRRAVLLINRASPDLERELEQRLGLEVDVVEVSNRRVGAAAERIANGSYDLVLSATGFQDHSVDAVIGRACRGAGVPMIRTDRSRPLACMRAIARQLGLRSAAE